MVLNKLQEDGYQWTSSGMKPTDKPEMCIPPVIINTHDGEFFGIEHPLTYEHATEYVVATDFVGEAELDDGVFIRGMKMPTGCDECPLKEFRYSRTWCSVTPSDEVEDEYGDIFTTRPSFCPLMERLTR